MSSLVWSGNKISVVTAGTAVALGSLEKDTAICYIQAAKSNTGAVIIGASNVLFTSLNGIVLEPPSLTSTATQVVLRLENSSLNKIFVDAANSGDGISIFYSQSSPNTGY